MILINNLCLYGSMPFSFVIWYTSLVYHNVLAFLYIQYALQAGTGNKVYLSPDRRSLALNEQQEPLLQRYRPHKLIQVRRQERPVSPKAPGSQRVKVWKGVGFS